MAFYTTGQLMAQLRARPIENEWFSEILEEN